MNARRGAGAVVAALVGAASLAACGGSASTITNAASTGASAKFQAGLKFSQCMRAHGVSGFPDPRPAGSGGGAGGVMLQDNPKNAPGFRAADAACRSLLPNQGRPPPLSPARQQAMLRFASCMRAHGLASFPDPQFNQTAGDISVNGGKLGANPAASPAFRSARAACGPALRAALGGDAIFSSQGPG